VSLAICVLITWFVIIVLTHIPKRLSELDMLFLYFVNTIFELSIFTVLHVNLKWIVVNHSFEESIADLVLRLIMIPLAFIITSNILLYPGKLLKRVIVVIIILSFIPLQVLVKKLGIIATPHLNTVYSLLMFSSYAIFSRFMAWVIVSVGRKEVKKV
jgi:hypothetical protein